MDPWNRAVKSACDIQVDGKHGPGRPKVIWKQLTEGSQSGSSQLSTIMIDTPEVWCKICHACSKPASWKGVLPLDLHVNQNGYT